MRIGFIGAGNIGGTVARQLVKLGHQVSISNSRGRGRLTALAADIGATPVSVVDGPEAGEVGVLSIPTKAVADLPRELFANAPGCVVIDTGNYHPELRDGRIEAIGRGMLDSQWVAQQIGHPVVKAFNNIFAKSLLEKGVPRGTTGRIALSVFGDAMDAKAVASGSTTSTPLAMHRRETWKAPGVVTSSQARAAVRAIGPRSSTRRSCTPCRPAPT